MKTGFEHLHRIRVSCLHFFFFFSIVFPFNSQYLASLFLPSSLSSLYSFTLPFYSSLLHPLLSFPVALPPFLIIFLSHHFPPFAFYINLSFIPLSSFLPSFFFVYVLKIDSKWMGDMRSRKMRRSEWQRKRQRKNRKMRVWKLRKQTIRLIMRRKKEEKDEEQF